MKYTKGEWKAQGKRIVCTDEQNDVMAVAYEHPLMPKGMAEANARLIAAAPDMYEALKRLFKVLPKECGGCISTEHAMIEAQEALAKAEGVENG